MKSHIARLAMSLPLLVAVGCESSKSVNQGQVGAAPKTVTLQIDGFMKSKSGAT